MAGLRVGAADFWTVFCICYSRFDRWVVLVGSGAASSGHFRAILGGPGGSGPELKQHIFNSLQKAAAYGRRAVGSKPDPPPNGGRAANLGRMSADPWLLQCGQTRF